MGIQFFLITVHEVERITHLQDGYDDSKQPNGTAKDFHDENLNKEAGVLGISQSSPTAHDADADATEQIGKANSETCSEHGVAWKHGTIKMVKLTEPEVRIER